MNLSLDAMRSDESYAVRYVGKAVMYVAKQSLFNSEREVFSAFRVVCLFGKMLFTHPSQAGNGVLNDLRYLKAFEMIIS